MRTEIAVFGTLIILYMFFSFPEKTYTQILGKIVAIIIIIACTYVDIKLGMFSIFVILFIYYMKEKIQENPEEKYLDGVNCIYWINLDRSIDRKKKMENMFLDPVFSGKKIERIEAVDGLKENPCEQILCKKRRNTKLEYACLLSHLKAIQKFAEDSVYENALIFEDDVTLEFKKYWKKSVKEVIENAPKDWEIIQLCYNTTRTLNEEYTLNNYKVNEYGGIACMAAYVIHKKAAKKFIDETFDKNIKKYKLQDYHTHEADHYLFKCLRTYTYKYPFFIYPTENNSTLHPEDLESHVQSKKRIENMYMNNPKVIKLRV